MKTPRISPQRLRIYRMLVDGLGPGTGMTIPSIVDELEVRGEGVSPKTVYGHVRALKTDRFIRQIRGTKSPAQFERGKFAAVLDELDAPTCDPRHNRTNGGGPIVQNCCDPDKSPLTEAVILTGEAHIDGRYVFPVTSIGELYEPFRVRDPYTGEVSMVTVWEEEPKQLKGVQYYCGQVPIHGGINIQYWIGQTSKAIHIWPTPVELVPGRVLDAPEDLADKAIDVANWLGRYGGWRLGDPEFKPNKGTGIHYACNDPAVTGNFPLEFKGAIDEHNWVDSTPPPRAIETDEAERMDGVINYAAITRNLKQGQAAIGQDVAALEAAIERRQVEVLQHRYDALGQQAELWQAIGDMSEIQLRTIHAQTIQAHIDSMSGNGGSAPHDPATASIGDTDTDARKGGMYQ